MQGSRAGSHPSQQQSGKSFSQVKEAASGGDPDAAYALGYMYYYGQGTQQDVEMGKAWIHRAADQGQPMAIRALQLLDRVDTPKMQVPDIYSGIVETNPMDLGYGSQSQNAQAGKMAAPKRTLNYEGKERSLLSRPSNHYTLELTSSPNQEDIVNFLDRNKDLDRSQVYWYRDKNKNTYIVTYGTYSSDNDAMNAAEGLPRSVRNLKPWAKPISSVKSAIRASAKKPLPAEDQAKTSNNDAGAVSKPAAVTATPKAKEASTNATSTSGHESTTDKAPAPASKVYD
jgi:hypothetical protein